MRSHGGELWVLSPAEGQETWIHQMFIKDEALSGEKGVAQHQGANWCKDEPSSRTRWSWSRSQSPSSVSPTTGARPAAWCTLILPLDQHEGPRARAVINYSQAFQDN